MRNFFVGGLLLMLGVCLLSAPVRAQTIATNPFLIATAWQAQWIAAQDAPNTGYSVQLFRSTLELEAVPDSFVVHISAEQRYKFYVNGVLVSFGPARCSPLEWVYETLDIAPYLRSGKNAVAAVVWNFGGYTALAQMGNGQTGFLVQGNGRGEQVLNTNNKWKALRCEAFTPISANAAGYIVVGPCDRFDANQYPYGWEQAGFDDSEWKAARHVGGAGAKGARDYAGRQLVPRTIPQMEMTDQHTLTVRNGANKQFGRTIPANSTDTILLDNTVLTTAYLNLLWSKGKDANITMRYAESLYSAGMRGAKGNRNEIEGKVFRGYNDVVVSDGGDNRSYTTLWWRTYRYIQIEVQTADEPITLNSVYGTYTGYPFQLASTFAADGQPDLDRILEVGWRTARLCAHETYMDCPYYEQLQYFGDTRIQTMITLVNTRDDEMVRQVITQGVASMIPDGLTQSRYPSKDLQVIPGYSVSWIGILHDYMMWRGDSLFVADKLPAVRRILNYYERHLQADGTLSRIPYWFFTDWARGFMIGEPPRLPNGHSSVQDLTFLYGLQMAADMERRYGIDAMADYYDGVAEKIKRNFRAHYWNEAKAMFANTTQQDNYSQHSNILAILTGIVEGKESAELMQRIMSATDIMQTTLYFRYYYNLALLQSGLGDEYLNTLDVWRTALNDGLTTWPETPGNARSDCHAWSSSPNVELYRTVLGVQPADAGFEHVAIKPYLGSLTKASGTVPHPRGDIKVEYAKDSNGKLRATITLPQGVTGTLTWRGKTAKLRSGTQLITV